MDKVYNITLTEEQVKVYVTGLDSSIKLIANQLASNNSVLALKNQIVNLNKINDELVLLDKLIDEQNQSVLNKRDGAEPVVEPEPVESTK